MSKDSYINQIKDKFLTRKTTNQVQTTEVDFSDVSFDLKDTTLRQSLKLMTMQERMNTFEFIESFILEITSLSRQQTRDLIIQDAIAILVYHRAYFWDNLEIGDSPPLSPLMFIKEPVEEELSVKIGNYKFTNRGTLLQMQKAEQLAFLQGGKEVLSFYLLAAFCEKGLKSGVSAILDTKDTKEKRSSIRELNANLSKASNIRADFLQSHKNISIISNNNYSIGIEEGFFLPFLTKRL